MNSSFDDVNRLRKSIFDRIDEIKSDLEALPNKNLPPGYDPEDEPTTGYEGLIDDDDETDEVPLPEQLVAIYCNKKALKEILEAMHRNTKGRLFYQDHLLYERLYTEMDEAVDDLGEHILTYGGTLPGGVSAIAENSTIEETDYDVNDPESYPDYLLEYYDAYLEQLYDAMEEATELDRQGTMLLLQNEILLAEHQSGYLDGRVVS